MKTGQCIVCSARMAVAWCLVASALVANGASSESYRQINLVADQSGAARFIDPNLVNPWGIVVESGGRLIVADNHASVTTFYNRMGKPVPVTITIPAPGGGDSAPTDLALIHSGGDFTMGSGQHHGGSMLVLSTEDGTIITWNPSVNHKQAVIAVDNSGAGAIYKGMAIAVSSSGARLFAANFGQGRVEMYDSGFKLLQSFTDEDLAKTNYVPFGIRVIGGELFVTFAFKAAPTDGDETAGPGLGYVDKFDLEGKLIGRFASQGTLNAPWGLALAPKHFGKFSRALLVGSFGDGTISAYDPSSGAFLGQLADSNGSAIRIEGLWGLAFQGNGGGDTLYFTAGPSDENHGLLGALMPKPVRSRSGH